MTAQPDLWDRTRTLRYGPIPRPQPGWVRLGAALESVRVQAVELPIEVLLRVARETPLDGVEEDES